MQATPSQVIIVGGGLAGLSAAHTVLEHGGRVLVLDKQPFLGGNSVKATSGINGALTKTQVKLGIKDSVDAFYVDTAQSANGGKPAPISDYPLAKAMVDGSAASVEWLMDKFQLDLSLVSRLGGHSFPRTHRGKERFPGMTITYALMEKLEDIAKSTPDVARVLVKTRATKLITEGQTVVGVEYTKDGQTLQEYGPVVIATGGYGHDWEEDSLLRKYRPELLKLPTTNGDHCTGDGIKMAMAIGAAGKDLDYVQVHPTGLVHPDTPDDKIKFLAAEALRGVGGLMLDRDGVRFVNELGTRDYCSAQMQQRNKYPYRLVLNGKSAAEIAWHCAHYQGRGLMKKLSGAELAKEIGIPASKLEGVFTKYNADAEKGTDEFGKKYFQNLPYSMNDQFYVAIITPVVHYCMGGLAVDPATRVLRADKSAIPGLFVTGEAMGGTHGKNRLGGSSLLDCVVFGRVAGDSVSAYLFDKLLDAVAHGRANRLLGQLAPGPISIRVDPSSQRLQLDITWGGQGAQGQGAQAPAAQEAHAASSAPASSGAASAPGAAAPKAESKAAAKAAPAKPVLKEYTLEEVAKHKTDKDCWVVVNGQVLDVSKFLPDHPGGKPAIMLYAGKDATAEFNMLHKPDVVEKYAPYAIIGTLKGGSKPAH